MIRVDVKAVAMTSLLACILAMVALAPAYAWAAPSGVLPAAGAVTSDESSEAGPTGVSRLMAMADFNRDGVADIVKATLPAGAQSGPAFLTISLGQAEGRFQQISSRPMVGRAPRDMVAGDFNQDGIPDLIVGDEDGTLRLFLGDGTGNLIPAGEVAHLDSVVSMAVADFNHDGIPDLAVSDWRASKVTVLLGAGNGSFRSGWSAPLRLAGTSPLLTAADFNGDRIPDLAVVYADDEGDTFDVMLGNGSGSFTRSPRLSLVRDPNSHCAP